MSLINEALKKAQRNRTGEAADTVPTLPGAGGTRVTKRAQPRTSQQLVLLAAGAVVLVVLSVVATVYLVNRAPAPKPGATAPQPAPPSAAPAPTAPAPLMVPPVLNLPIPPPRPAPETPAAVAPSPESEKPATAPASRTAGPNDPLTVSPTAGRVASRPALPPRAPAAAQPGENPVAPPAPAGSGAAAAAPVLAGPPQHDERVSRFVDAIRVTGIRPSGTESRVLMNDRVFRIDEIVDRNFGLRLTKVEPNTLTFTDGNGAVYVKHF